MNTPAFIAKTEVYEPAPPDLAGATQRVGRQILDALSKLELYHERKDGARSEVIFCGVTVIPHENRAWATYEVDMQRLPQRVTADDLVCTRTVHHLSSVCGHKVIVANSTGVTYVVPLHRERAIGVSRALPRLAPFIASDWPAEIGPAIPIGLAERGPVWMALDGAGHVLVAGATRSGKTSFLHAAIAGLALTHTPGQVRIAFIDPKGNECAPWRELRHLYAPPATSAAEAGALVGRLVDEMTQRGQLLAGAAARSTSAYNAMAEAKGLPRLPAIVVFIDEFVDLVLEAGAQSTLVKGLTRLASKGAGLGITLVFATQNPRSDVFDALIRGNCPVRIAFAVPEAAQSRAILGQGGAERIPTACKGRLLARLPSHGLVEAQGYFVSDDALRDITRSLGAAASQPASIEADEITRELAAYAMRHLDGRFTVNKLFSAFAPRYKKHQIETLARRLEMRGLLTTPSGPTDSRHVTEALLKQCNARG